MKRTATRRNRGGRDAFTEVSGARRRVPTIWRVYAGLFLVFVLVLAGIVRFGQQEGIVQRVGPEFAAELLGILVTVAFVQQLLAREERGRKMRASVGPLRKGRVALGCFLEGWGILLKGAYDPRRTEFPRTIEQFLAPHYTEDLKFVDPRPSPGEGPAWVERGVTQLREGQEKLREIIAIYGPSLDPDYLEAIDELADDEFIPLLIALVERQVSEREWRVAITQSPGYREAHFFRLVHALSLHRELARAAARYRSRSLAPSARSMSLRMKADYDLAIPARIDSSWWAEEPRVGALRSR